MKVYLDTSVLVALLTDDPLTERADAFFRSRAPIAVVSDFAAAEFASALGRRVRMNEIDAEQARAAFSTLDHWLLRVAHRVELNPSDVADAATFLRRLDLTLRTPDALNIALCRRASAVLATFDDKMAAAAQALGLEIVTA
ncbi:type II toxin-antitoxin system VapC family toxin [uncultured Methylobacterium sp.]|uniref:type II toxin-antitoxin system VapC family toxin n=1 Tax=uncultured Methylobacterium sp. TaxID=157278 RepID=UPI0035CA9DE1